MKDLYLARNGNSKGLDAFMKTANEKEQVRRRAHILQERIAEPKVLQAFTMRSIDGAEVSSEKLKGKVLVINFWGTWCGPCKFELPAIQKFYDKYHAQNDVVFLTVDVNDDLKTVKQFMAEKKYTFPVLMEAGYADHANIGGYPTTWFVGRDGKIAYEKMGASRRIVDEFTWRIDDLLKAGSANAVQGQ
jgi:thiol-disulfide isomerase/thioredoxin